MKDRIEGKFILDLSGKVSSSIDDIEALVKESEELESLTIDQLMALSDIYFVVLDRVFSEIKMNMAGEVE
jgi:hypothetical protein